MRLLRLITTELLGIFLLSSTLYAQATNAAPAQQLPLAARLSQMLPMVALLFLVFYFMVFKPQNDKERKHQELLADLKKGQRVITSSGIIGRVAGIEKDYILLEVDSNTKIKVQTAHIVKRYEPEVTKK